MIYQLTILPCKDEGWDTSKLSPKNFPTRLCFCDWFIYRISSSSIDFLMPKYSNVINQFIGYFWRWSVPARCSIAISSPKIFFILYSLTWRGWGATETNDSKAIGMPKNLCSFSAPWSKLVNRLRRRQKKKRRIIFNRRWEMIYSFNVILIRINFNDRIWINLLIVELLSSWFNIT